MSVDADIRDQAVQHLERTSIGYTTWEDRVLNGYRGKPYDPKSTEWKLALDLLAQIGVVPPPPPPPSGFGWVPGDPLPTVPTSATKVTQPADLLSLLQSVDRSGYYDATGLQVGSTDRFVIEALCPTGKPLTVWLNPNVRFVKASLRTDPSAEAVGAQNVTLYGGDLTNDKGAAFNARGKSATVGCVNFKWYGFKAHDVAGGGVSCHGNTGPVDGLDLRGEIINTGVDDTLEPPGHSPHTGLQAAYMGQNPGTYPVTNSKMAFYIHDLKAGSALQWSHLLGYEIWLRAIDILGDAPTGSSGTEGNALSPFDGSSDHGVVHYVEATNCHKVLNQAGSGGAGGTLVIEKGRGTGIRSAPEYDEVGNTALTLVDCT